MGTGKELGSVLLTGGSSTLGRAIAASVAPFSSNIATTSRAPVDSLGTTIKADFRNPDGFTELYHWFAGGRTVNTLINNAGIYLRRPLADMTWQDWQELFSVNLFATAEVIRLAVSAGCTNVVNITDAGWHRAWPNHSAYLAAKAAVVALTRTLASELAPTVRVNAVAPGIVTIPESATASPTSLLARIPAGRLGSPEEVAEVVKSILLAPPYLTGEVVAVDGGYGHR
jgi:pteridine reductase